MEFLNTIKYHLTQADEKTFFAYIGGFLLGILPSMKSVKKFNVFLKLPLM